MKIQTITSWNNKLYKEYAHRFEKTYNWPFDLVVYNEDKDMFDKIPDLKKFIDRNKHREIESFKKDGVRFSYKVYAYTHAIENASKDIDGLICIDADSVFYKPIDIDWIKQHIHKDDCMMSYLGRGSNYSECGFLYFNMQHKSTKTYAREMKRMYDSDELYQLTEKHDSYIWDHVRKAFESNGVKNHNIGDGKPGHVQARSVLGTIYDHIKGPKRKQLLRSPEARV